MWPIWTFKIWEVFHDSIFLRNSFNFKGKAKRDERSAFAYITALSGKSRKMSNLCSLWSAFTLHSWEWINNWKFWKHHAVGGIISDNLRVKSELFLTLLFSMYDVGSPLGVQTVGETHLQANWRTLFSGSPAFACLVYSRVQMSFHELNKSGHSW